MSRNAVLLEKAETRAAMPAPRHSVPHSGDYGALIRRLYRPHSAFAVVGIGAGARSGEACQGIAAELAASGKRIVVVSVDALLQAGSVPPMAATSPGKVPNVCHWPSTMGVTVDFFHPTADPGPGTGWLALLCRDFDAVLLDCPSPECAPGCSDVAALADFAILVIESGVTARQAIQRAQHKLESSGVQLAGCILMQRR